MVLFTSKRNIAKVLSMIFAVSIGFGSWANTNDVSVVHPQKVRQLRNGTGIIKL